MQQLRNLTARRALLLAMPVAALTLLIAGGYLHLNEGKQPPAQDETPAVQDGAADRTEEAPIERKSVLRPKEKSVEPLPFENGKLVPDNYKWWDPHPWLVPVRGEEYRRYIGPQTAEAIFAVFHSMYESGKGAEKVLAHWERVLARGAVVNDVDDTYVYGSLMAELYNIRHDPAFYRRIFDLSADASIEEIEEAMIARKIRTWPVDKEQFHHARKTGENTLNVTLFPDGRGSGAIGISTVGRGPSRDLTDEEMYNISRFGIAPKGYRLRFMDEDKNEIPLDRVPFFNERDAVKHMSDADLEELLVGIPVYLSQPDAQEQSTVIWMSLVDRYDAALALLAERGQVPDPASVPSSASRRPPAPMVDWGDPDPRRVQKAEPPGLREAPDDEAMKAQEKARVAEAERRRGDAEAERRRRVAEAYIAALEKHAAEAKISSSARSQIARRIQELRVLMTGPAGPPGAPPSPPPSAQDSKREEE